jgi:hypothetical protein
MPDVLLTSGEQLLNSNNSGLTPELIHSCVQRTISFLDIVYKATNIIVRERKVLISGQEDFLDWHVKKQKVIKPDQIM